VVFGLLCACDLAVAADDIRIGTPEPRVGVTPMMILPFMLRVLPLRRLQEMCVTGEHFTAREALEWGVVNYVVPRAELDTKVNGCSERILDKSPTAIRLGKQAFNAMRDMFAARIAGVRAAMVPVMSSTDDAREGMEHSRTRRARNGPVDEDGAANPLSRFGERVARRAGRGVAPIVEHFKSSSRLSAEITCRR